jgi:hypothetical protein
VVDPTSDENIFFPRPSNNGSGKGGNGERVEKVTKVKRGKEEKVKAPTVQ